MAGGAKSCSSWSRRLMQECGNTSPATAGGRGTAQSPAEAGVGGAQTCPTLTELEEKVDLLAQRLTGATSASVTADTLRRLIEKVGELLLFAEKSPKEKAEKGLWRVVAYRKKGSPYLQTYAHPHEVRLEEGEAQVLNKDGKVIDEEGLRKLPLGAFFESFGQEDRGSAAWLSISDDRKNPQWVLKNVGSELVNCIKTQEFAKHPGPIPASAHPGQEYPKAMFTEGYGGTSDICVVSASGDNLWRELNKEMLFRGYATATVFEEQWGGDQTFTDWVAYYALNVGIHAGLGNDSPKTMIVTIKNTLDYAKYPKFGPEIGAVQEHIGRAQYKECEWLQTQMVKKDMPWEKVQFMTSFQFLMQYANWSQSDCQDMALKKVSDQLKQEDAQEHHFNMAIACLFEAYNVHAEDKLSGAAADLYKKVCLAKVLKETNAEKRLAGVQTILACCKGMDDELFGLLAKLIADESGEVRKVSVQALLALASQGDEAVHSRDGDERARSRCVDEAVRRLTERSADTDANARCKAAVDLLGALVAKGSSTTVSLLTPYMQHDQVSCRKAAVQTMGVLARRGDEAALRLIGERLQDTDSHVRLASVQTLGALAQHGDEAALRLLGERLQDDGIDMHLASVEALGTLAPRGHYATLQSLAKHFGRCRRANYVIATALGAVLEKGSSVTVPLLAPLLQRANAGTAGTVVQLLGEKAPRQDEAALKLIADYGHKSHHRERVVEALRAVMEQRSAAAVSLFAPFLKDSCHRVRRAAVKALGDLSPHGDETALRLLAEKCGDESHYVKFLAAGTLMFLSGETPTTWPAVISSVQDQNCLERLPAVRGLVASRMADAATQELLRACLKDERPQVRIVAARALSKIRGRGDAEILAALAPFLQKDESVVEALGDVCEVGTPGVALLAPHLKAKQPGIRRAAVKALGKLGHAAVGELRPMLEDEDFTVRMAARGALEE